MRNQWTALGFCACAVSALVMPRAAEATVFVDIDLTHQRMHVEGREGVYDWPISSARSGFYTPGGSFAPTHLELMHYSRKYDMSPMPHAIFFRGGYAIHGTYSTASLGRPASHGCVRLSPGNAARLYAMVQHEGARIAISGTPPASAPFAVAHRVRRSLDADALARLAPRSPATTVYQDYGDAPYARARAYRRGGNGYAYGYVYAPEGYAYRPGYSYAPSYLASPQIFGGSPYAQSPLIPFGTE